MAVVKYGTSGGVSTRAAKVSSYMWIRFAMYLLLLFSVAQLSLSDKFVLVTSPRVCGE